jgi:hypothetical protein
VGFQVAGAFSPLIQAVVWDIGVPSRDVLAGGCQRCSCGIAQAVMAGLSCMNATNSYR